MNVTFARCELTPYPVNIYMFKVNKEKHQKKVWNTFKINNKNTRTTSCFFVNSEHISRRFLLFLIVGFEKVNVSWGQNFTETFRMVSLRI